MIGREYEKRREKKRKEEECRQRQIEKAKKEERMRIENERKERENERKEREHRIYLEVESFLSAAKVRSTCVQIICFGCVAGARNTERSDALPPLATFHRNICPRICL